MLAMSRKVELGWSLMPFTLICFLSRHTLADDTGGLLQIQNADFESAPAGLAPNSTLIRSLPGWQLQGTVHYVTAGENISLPNDAGHAIQLGRDGVIAQILNMTSRKLYALTFTVTEEARDNCEISSLLNVTVDGGSSSQVFDSQDKYSPEAWGTYAWGFLVGEGGARNLSLRSQIAAGRGPDSNITCGPVVDALFIKELTFPSRPDPGNLLLNGDFEQGPYSSSVVGVFLAPTPNSTVSALPGWNVGPSEPVKFIDKAHFAVPHGNSAVELVSSDPGAIQQSVNSVPGQRYTLTFHVGDGNDTCNGDMPVRVKAGPLTTNVTYNSRGTGNSEAFRLEFVANSTTTSLSFTSMRRNFGLGSAFCGPVIDNVVLVASWGFIWKANVITTLLVALSLIFSID